MIFNQNILFIHVPKTGGMAVTEYLMKVLDPVVYVTEAGAREELIHRGRVQMLPGKRHEFLDECDVALQQRGRAVADFELVLAVVRHPYEMELSRYFYLRNGHPWDKGPAQEMAMTADFETFALESLYHGRPDPMIHRFYTIEDAMPPNMRILRHEKLMKGLTAALKTVGVKTKGRLRRVNVSRNSRSKNSDYLTDKAKAAIYSRFKWIFDQGFYRP